MKRQMHSEHAELVDIASGIVAAARRLAESDVTEINKLRLKLSQAITRHCSGEQLLVEGSASANDHPQRDALMRRYHDELLLWRRGLIECNTAWPPARIAADPGGFLRQFEPIVAALRARIIWEETVFYPAILPQLARAA